MKMDVLRKIYLGISPALTPIFCARVISLILHIYSSSGVLKWSLMQEKRIINTSTALFL